MPTIKAKPIAFTFTINPIHMNKKNWWNNCGCMALILVLLVGCNTQQDKEPMGTVVRLADGDTFTLLMPGNEQVKVRLYGIDSPERGQDFGTAARDKMSELTTGYRIRLQEKDKDRYGRTVAIAFREDGLNLNEEMLRTGMAWHYAQYDKNNFEWSQLEAEARNKKIGLWSQSRPTQPWEWRKQKRENNSKKKKSAA